MERSLNLPGSGGRVPKGPPREGRVQSVVRSIDILLALAGGSLSLGAVANATGLPKGTAFRLLATLGYQNLIVKDPVSGVYMLGPGLLRLAQGVTRGGAIVASLAKPGLITLWEQTQETITLHVRAGSERICVEELPGRHPVRYTATVGSAAPLHAGSAGKVLLAFMSEAERERLLRTLHLFSITPQTITDVSALRRELELIRKQGWAFSASEGVEGVNAISAPIRAPHGLTLAVSIVGPAVRLTRKLLLSYGNDLLRAARTIERSLVVAPID
jgi:DNA-binding IclR family transcriptional regulator